MTRKDYEINETVECIDSDGYPALRKGNKYTVIGYEEEYHDKGFTFPAYLIVKTEDGRRLACHTYRFKKQ